jgi:hypothetical protein
MSVWRNRQIRAAYNQEIFVADSDSYWYVATDRDTAEQESTNRLHVKAPIFAYEREREPIGLLKKNSTAFLVMKSDTVFVVRLRAGSGSDTVTEDNVGKYLSVYGVLEKNLTGGSLIGLYASMKKNGLHGVNAAASSGYDLSNSPLFIALLENPTFGELCRYLPRTFSSATKQEGYDNKTSEGLFSPNLGNLLGLGAA